MGSSLLALFTNEESAKILTALAESRIGTSRVMASLLATDGTRVACSMAMQNQADGETQRIAIVVTDMTAWLRLEAASERSSRALRMVNACNKIVIRATDEVQMLAGICQTMVDEGGYELAWVGYAEHDEAKSVRPVARSQRYEHYVENARITWADNERGRGPTGTAIRAGRSIIAHDTEIDPQYGPWRRMAQEMGFRSSATFPLYANHDVIGALMVYSARPDGFDTDEEQLLTGLVGNIEFGIVALRNKNVRSRLATIVEAAGDAIIGRDLDGTVTAWNHAAERMLGYRAGEIIGRPMTALVPQVLTGESDWLFDKAMRGETIEQFDTIRLAKDGRQIPVSLTYSPIRGNAGEVVAVAVFMRDNTARKNAEEALRRIREQHEAAIRTSELRYRRRFETAADGIVVANARTHRVQDVNPAFVSMLGYSRDECLGRTLEEFGLLRAEAGEEVPLEEMGDTGDYYRRAALPIRAKDGQQIDVEFVAVIFQVGDEMTIQCNLRDITARRYFEQALQQKNRELEDANRAKDRFLANMSHEFRTPLTGIIGFTGTLLMRLPGDLTAAQEKQLRTVQSNAKQLLSLINDLLNLAKIESGKIELNLEDVDCKKILQDVAASLGPLAAAKGLAFDVIAPPRDVVVTTSHRAVWQIITNLTANAVKFTTSGGISLELRSIVADDGRRTEIAVSDTGIGIRAEDHDKLFQAFSRIENPGSRHEEGTGLGLCICEKLAHLIGGKLTFVSDYRQGSTFTLVLPHGADNA